MATPNKFSNPDTPACDCLRLYAGCLIINPLQAICCLPCVCCAWAHKQHQKQGGILDGVSQEKEITDKRESEGTIDDQPSQQPGMAMVPDASKPKDQWPAEWHSPRHGTYTDQAKKSVKRDDAEAGGTKDKTIKDKLADSVLKVATAG
ncbi:hypothetical protein F4801DRAFT_4096 [Xylaria longipes]|nr:hypothetical protein F4801DRAFT_4096 [Xylaria longipes]RYC63034.1 hypothetical protein CHU98_g3203 [Xylaria longipes]